LPDLRLGPVQVRVKFNPEYFAARPFLRGNSFLISPISLSGLRTNKQDGFIYSVPCMCATIGHLLRSCFVLCLVSLIADDNSNIRLLLRTFIENQTPFKVCAEGKFWRGCYRESEEFLPDVALLDLAMPDLNGIEVASVLSGLFQISSSCYSQ